MIRIISILIRVAIVFFLWLAGNIANAQETIKACPGAKIRSIDVSSQYKIETYLDIKPETILISAPTSSTTSDAPGKAVSIIVLGPVLGSMDSPEIETAMTCTWKGFLLTAIITRNADYNGALLANILWRPKIKITAVVLQPDINFKTIWRMRLATGVEVRHAQTPGYPAQHYPITESTTVH